MQVSYGLYWRFFVDLAYLKESVENAFLVVSFTHKTISKKIIKIQFNFAL